MNFEEFLNRGANEQEQPPEEANEIAEVDDEAIAESIDVQKAVVESLAADKAVQDEKIAELTKENEELKSANESLKAENEKLKSEKESLKSDNDKIRSEMLTLSSEKSSLKMKLIETGDLTSLKNEVAKLRVKCAEQLAALEKVGDVLSKNADTQLSNKLSLLDRDEEIPDRFPSETREHVLEVIAEAYKKAEEEGCVRRAQLLEGVLLMNKPEGTLAEKRAQLEKIFAANGNIVSGPVIDELNKLGISHKNGESYLLPSEIIKRTY